MKEILEKEKKKVPTQPTLESEAVEEETSEEVEDTAGAESTEPPRLEAEETKAEEVSSLPPEPTPDIGDDDEMGVVDVIPVDEAPYWEAILYDIATETGVSVSERAVGNIKEDLDWIPPDQLKTLIQRVRMRYLKQPDRYTSDVAAYLHTEIHKITTPRKAAVVTKVLRPLAAKFGLQFTGFHANQAAARMTGGAVIELAEAMAKEIEAAPNMFVGADPDGKTKPLDIAAVLNKRSEQLATRATTRPMAADWKRSGPGEPSLEQVEAYVNKR